MSQELSCELNSNYMSKNQKENNDQEIDIGIGATYLVP